MKNESNKRCFQLNTAGHLQNLKNSQKHHSHNVQSLKSLEGDFDGVRWTKLERVVTAFSLSGVIAGLIVVLVVILFFICSMGTGHLTA